MEGDTGRESKSYIMKDLEWCVKEPDLWPADKSGQSSRGVMRSEFNLTPTTTNTDPFLCSFPLP